MIKRLQYAFAGESVQGPEQDEIEPAPGCILEQLLELWSVCSLAGRSIHVLVLDGPLRAFAEIPQLVKLILGVLASVVLRDSSVQCKSHDCTVPESIVCEYTKVALDVLV